MNTTSIEWTDKTWNPITGCLHGCTYCYARAITRRFRGSFEPALHSERMRQPKKLRKPSKIFVGSMADVFGAWVPREWIDAVFDVVRACQQHTFQFLTKNPERCKYFDWPINAWAGATVCTRDDERKAWHLEECNAYIRYISVEPMLGPIRLAGLAFIDWVIIGAQTGAGAHQPQHRWVETLTADARAIDAAVFYKPSLTGYDNPPQEFPCY
jgi:protein gp37